MSEDIVENSIDRLLEEARIPSRSRSRQISPIVNSICGHAYERGLSNEQLGKVLTLLRSHNHLDQGSVTTLIKGLFPAERVSPTLIRGIIASLGQGEEKPSTATQGLLLRWIILVYDVLEDLVSLQKLYSVLFNLLDMLSIRPDLCHLLALLTRRNNVKSFRIQMLLEINRGFGSDPSLTGLLRLYKEYHPEIIVSSGRGAQFKYPDLEWRQRLRDIQENALSTEEQAEQIFQVTRNGVKRRRVDLVPEVHTHHVSERSVALEEVHGVNDFVEKFDRIEPPSQLIAALDDPLLRTYVVLKQDEAAQRRLDNWLTLFLDSQLQAEADGEETSNDLHDILNKLLKYTQYTKKLPPSFKDFVAKYLGVWNGQSNRNVVLELLSFLSVEAFEDLQESLFDNLEGAILDDSRESCTDLLSFYTKLLQNWTSNILTMEEPPTSNPLGSLVSHASSLILRILTTYPNISAQATVLHHLGTLANTISYAPTNPIIRILTPSTKAIYLLSFLSPTTFTLSSLTSTLAIYKVKFEDCIAKQHATGAGPEYPRPYVNEFNGFLMDICNLIWRSRAFNTTDTNALGCLLPVSVYPALRRYTENSSPPYALQGLFSLSYHPALAALSIAALREMEDHAVEEQGEPITERHAGPVTQRSLALLGQNGGIKVNWSDYRLEVLQWLADRGVEGVRDLMFRTMKLLMTKSPVEASTPQALQVGR